MSTEPNEDNPTLKLEFGDGENKAYVIIEFHFSDNFDEKMVSPFVNGVGGLLLNELG